MRQKTASGSTRRSEGSRRAILEAALTLVGEVGYERLTIEGIAGRAKVGKQTIYRWWPSKAAVLLDAFTAKADAGDFGGSLPDSGDLAGDLKFSLRATVDEFSDPDFQAPYRALAVAAANDAVVGEQFISRLLEPGNRVYVDRLRSAQEAGDIAAGVDLRVAVDLLLGPFTNRWLIRSGELTYEFVDTLVDMVINGLRPGS
jgi:AcrR family transcriptional regulator